MVQSWDTVAKPKPVLNVDDPDVWMQRQSEGIDTAVTRYWGTTDPSAGAGWGSAQRGALWEDEGADEYNPTLKEWLRFDTGGTDYAWRPVRSRRVFNPEPRVAVTMPFASPAGADQPWTTLSLATLLLTLQDPTFQKVKPAEVVLEVEVTADAAETLGAADGYLAFRKKGGTDEVKVLAQVPARPIRDNHVVVPLDANGDLETRVIVGGGAPAFVFAVKVVEVREAEAA